MRFQITRWRSSSWSAARHPELLVILFFSLLIRLFLADKNSYWLDELYSVVLYGIGHETATEAIRYLAETSVHPPLYQWILFHWMELVGHSEIATRALSTLYVIASIFVLYWFALNSFGKRVAVAATLMYSIAHASIFYSLETRSYAQTMFLSVLSIYALQGYLSLLRERSWIQSLKSGFFVLFCVSNVLLLMTHYYNILFIAAQALFTCLFMVYRVRGRLRLFGGLLEASVPYVVQVGVFALAWAGTLASTLRRYLQRGSGAGNTTWDGPTQGPLSTYHEAVLVPNFPVPTAIILLFTGLVVLAFLPYLKKIKRTSTGPSSDRAWWWLLVLSCALVPFVVHYFLSAVIGAERIAARYFIFAVAPSALLLILGFEKFVSLIIRVFHFAKIRASAKIRGFSIGRIYLHHSTLAAVVLALMVAGPGGYKAAIHEKQDWRGIAKQVVQLVKGDPRRSYLVYETSFRNVPTLDYYLERFGNGEVQVHANFLRGHDRRKNFRFRRDLEVMKDSDYIIVVFTHHRERQFRDTLRALSKEFRLVRRNLDEAGRGYVVYGQK